MSFLFYLYSKFIRSAIVTDIPGAAALPNRPLFVVPDCAYRSIHIGSPVVEIIDQFFVESLFVAGFFELFPSTEEHHIVDGAGVQLHAQYFQ